MEANKVAKFWQSDDDVVNCNLCPQNCKLKEGVVGICRTRQNVGGELHSLNYGLISSYGLDPIEKKPLYHFYPGSYILSVGTFGCNLKCQFCQNHSIAHGEPDTIKVTSEELIQKALMYENCIGLAFTYNEPTVWYEFVYDTCVMSKSGGLKNVLVTNGFINQEPLVELLPYIDAMNIDVKAFNNDFYKTYCKGNLNSVKSTVEISAKHCHIEITTLIIPGLNDNANEIKELSAWLSEISPDIPLHLSRYFPNYKMNISPTPKETLFDLQKEAKKHLKNVYIGNV